MPAATGRTLAVGPGGNLQAALDAAHPGDVITLAPGATYTGNFMLPRKAAAGWIIIRPALPDAALPAAGQRMTPARAAGARLPRIVTPNADAALATAAGAHHYRIVGIEVTLTGRQRMTYALVTLGKSGDEGQTTVRSIPSHIVLDRMYIHGSSTAKLRRCVALNSATSAVIDSHLGDCHDTPDDAQAIGGWNGPGPFRIVNNYLEGSGENILFGGADPGIPNLVPSDIEIRRNHITRPTSWKGVWKVKNLLELKNARRVLIEGNVFEHNWADGQDGEAILLVSVNQNGTAPWSGVQDITIRRNIIRHVGAGFLISTYTDQGPVERAERISISDNLIYDIRSTHQGTGRTFMLTGDVRDFQATRNTIVEPSNSILSMDGGPKPRLVVTDNLGGGGAYGIAGSGVIGARALAHHAPDGVFKGNVLAMPVRSDEMPPAGNWYPSSLTEIGFQNPARHDYRLAPSSRHRGVAAGGRNPGADMAAVLAATRDVTQQ
ncbi:MAG TPA: hypothetical protein VFZ56_00630 [Gemmatimonadaceae bacterium]